MRACRRKRISLTKVHEKKMPGVFRGVESGFRSGSQKISVTMPDNAGLPYFSHTVAGAYLIKTLERENLVPDVFRDGQSESDIRF
ncbi:hypothetical protein TNCV_2584261 [Trichonephila clavipes]|nr:hypothetical protein TNCV_2584261 [Trichonephila clavipes]